MNKSSLYSSLHLTIVSVERNVVSYRLASAKARGVFKWTAKTATDLEVARRLKPGHTYTIQTKTDRAGVQHWTKVTELPSATQQNYDGATLSKFF